MSCWGGQMPHMTDEQMRQAIEAYYGMYKAGFTARWQVSPWTPPLDPCHLERPRTASSPKSQSRARLETARAVDKAGAIDVEFVRVR